MSDEGAAVGVVLLLLFAVAIYFLPGIIAAARHKRNTVSIFALNLFLGWSLIGWVIALVWALAQDAPPPAVYYQGPVYQPQPPARPEAQPRPPSVLGL
jgi:hypothetical protein